MCLALKQRRPSHSLTRLEVKRPAHQPKAAQRCVAFLRLGMGKLTNLKPRVGALPDRVKLAPKVPDPFYLSKEWKNLCAILARVRPKTCARQGCESRVRIWNHIVERRDGGAALDPDNIEGLCFRHHQQHTAAARAKRAQRGA